MIALLALTFCVGLLIGLGIGLFMYGAGILRGIRYSMKSCLVTVGVLEGEVDPTMKAYLAEVRRNLEAAQVKTPLEEYKAEEARLHAEGLF